MEWYVQYFDLFGQDENQRLLERTIVIKEQFENAQVVDYSDDYPDWRRAQVSFRDYALNEFYALLSKNISENYAQVCERLSVETFSAYDVEIQVTAHNDGDFFKQHRDASDDGINNNRVLTFAYYFHKTPKFFSGGELVIFADDQAILIEPSNDMIIFFNPKTLHEVKMVHCPEKKFEYSRFTLNGWIKNK